jgi:hypothetical protein
LSRAEKLPAEPFPLRSAGTASLAAAPAECKSTTPCERIAARLKPCPDTPRNAEHAQSPMSLRTTLLPALIAALLVSVNPCAAVPSQTESRSAAASQTIDRVVASVDGMAITQSDVETEYRTEVFLEEGRVPSMLPDAKTTSQILERVIDQKLLMGEAAAEHADLANSQLRAEQTLADVRNQFSSEEAFHAALRSLGLNEDDLLTRIEEQELILRIVDQKLRPLVSVGHDEIEAYYRTTFLPEWAKKSKENPPVLADVEAQIQEILVQRKIDEQLEVWLKELRAAHHVREISSISS